MSRWLLFFLFLLLCMLSAAPVLAGEGGAAATEEPETVSVDGTMRLLAPLGVELGDPFLIRLTSLVPLEEASVYWLGREVLPAVSVWNDKHVVLAMLGTDVQVTSPGPSQLLVVVTANGQRVEFSRAIMVREKIFPEEEANPSPPLSKQELARVEREAREAAAAMNMNTPLRSWFLPLDRPVQAAVSGPYGSRRLAYGRQMFRRGVDMALPPGSPVKACGTGKVVLVANHLLAGRSVYLDHGNGVVSMYFHLLRADVTLGQSIARGEVLGLSGATGRGLDAAQAKLHFAVAVQGRLVDPEPLFINNAEGLLQQEQK